MNIHDIRTKVDELNIDHDAKASILAVLEGAINRGQGHLTAEERSFIFNILEEQKIKQQAIMDKSLAIMYEEVNFLNEVSRFGQHLLGYAEELERRGYTEADILALSEEEQRTLFAQFLEGEDIDYDDDHSDESQQQQQQGATQQ